MKKYKKGSVVLWAIVITVLILGVLGYLYYSNTKQPALQNNINQVFSNSSNKIETNRIDTNNTQVAKNSSSPTTSSSFPTCEQVVPGSSLGLSTNPPNQSISCGYGINNIIINIQVSSNTDNKIDYKTMVSEYAPQGATCTAGDNIIGFKSSICPTPEGYVIFFFSKNEKYIINLGGVLLNGGVSSELTKAVQDLAINIYSRI